MEAINTPTRRSRREANTAEMTVGQRPDVKIPLTGSIDRETEEIEMLDGPLHPDYAQALAFMEEPVMIRLDPMSGENAPTQVQCHVNGKGAEVLIRGKWLEMGWLPVGQPIVLKRKYLEVLAYSKPTSIKTDVIEQPNQDPINIVRRNTSTKHPLSVLQDNNPLGHEWLTRIIADQG